MLAPHGKEVDLPAELDRREKRLARLQAARAQIETEAAACLTRRWSSPPPRWPAGGIARQRRMSGPSWASFTRGVSPRPGRIRQPRRRYCAPRTTCAARTTALGTAKPPRSSTNSSTTPLQPSAARRRSVTVTVTVNDPWAHRTATQHKSYADTAVPHRHEVNGGQTELPAAPTPRRLRPAAGRWAADRQWHGLQDPNRSLLARSTKTTQSWHTNHGLGTVPVSGTR